MRPSPLEWAKWGKFMFQIFSHAAERTSVPQFKIVSYRRQLFLLRLTVSRCLVSPCPAHGTLKPNMAPTLILFLGLGLTVREPMYHFP